MGAAVLGASLGVSEPALADNECGALVGGSVTCIPSPTNYPTGISYSQATTIPLTVTLDPNVNVLLNASGIGVQLSNTGDAILHASGATINATVPALTIGANNNGVHVESFAGSAIVTASGRIDAAGHGGENAIGAFTGFAAVGGTPGGEVSVTYTGPTTGPGLTSSGNKSTGIQAGNTVGGNATIDASGNVSGSVIPPGSGFLPFPGAQEFIGLDAASDVFGDASVHYRSGTIDVSGNRAVGHLRDRQPGLGDDRDRFRDHHRSQRQEPRGH